MLEDSEDYSVDHALFFCCQQRRIFDVFEKYAQQNILDIHERPSGIAGFHYFQAVFF